MIVCLLAAAAAASSFPKKYDPLVHGDKRANTYGNYKKKYEYQLKAPEGNSYDEFSGTPEDAILPPAEYPYLNAEGIAHGDLSPPPKFPEDDPMSSYVVYNKDGDMTALIAPAVSSYAIIPETNESADAMSLLRFMVRALPQDSSYSRYQADSEPEDLTLPDRLPESSYIAYIKEGKSEKIKVPASEPKVEKSMSSYSSYA